MQILVQYSLVMNLGGLRMTVAEVGNIVEFYDGLRGRVEKINDNSVIVDLTIMDNFNELDLPEKQLLIINDILSLNKKVYIKMKNISKALIWFIASFIVFHLILFVMWGEHQEYWYLYTGIMLIAGISYVFYQRDIESKRLLTSIGVGIATGIVLVIIQLIFSLLSPQITYAELIKELSRTGVYFKWQMLVTLIFVIPCHELYMRTVLQKELTQFKLPTWLIILITALCSSSLFIYLDKWWIVAFIFVAQLVLSLSYQYTRRIVTTSLGQIVAIILLLIFHG